MTYNTLLSLIFAILSTGIAPLCARSLLMGTIQFSKNSTIHPIRCYYGGKIVPTHSHGAGLAKVTFDITKNNDQNRFYMLIVEESTHRLKDVPEQKDFQNTIDHLCACSSESYKFFVLDLVQDEQDATDQSVEALLKTQQPTYHWEIYEKTLPDNCSIPDTTIIIYYFPQHVKEVRGGSHLELPTIFIDNSSMAQNISQDAQQDALIKLQLAAIDTDTIHAPSKRKIKEENHRLLIMDIV